MMELRALRFAVIAIVAVALGCSTSEEASVEVAGQEAEMGFAAGIGPEDELDQGEVRETGFAADANLGERRIDGGECYGRLEGVGTTRSGFSARSGGAIGPQDYSRTDTYREDRFSSLPSRESRLGVEGEVEAGVEGEAGIEGDLEAEVESDTAIEGDLETDVESDTAIEGDDSEMEDDSDLRARLGEEDEGDRTMEVAADRLVPAPPEGFVKASEAGDLPDFVPGLGQLYVKEDSMPSGPWLGYDKDGTLVNVVIMVPQSGLQDMESPEDLVDLKPGVLTGRINHVDILPAEGHAGLEEPHFHVVLWFISHDQEKDRIEEAHK